MNEIEAKNLVMPIIDGCTIISVEDCGELYCVSFVNTEYFETGKLENLTIGYGPSFVEKSTKKVFTTGSGQSVEFSLRAYNETGNVYAGPSDTLRLKNLEQHTRTEAILAIKSALLISLRQAKSIYEDLEHGNSIEYHFQPNVECELAIKKLKAAGIVAKVVWK